MNPLERIAVSAEEIYDIELEHRLLEANEKLAAENRALLDEHHVTALDVMGAVGSGKTTLISRLVERIKDHFELAVFNGDSTIYDDTQTIRNQGVPVVQIATIRSSHLDANVVSRALRQVDLDKLNLIFIENIGNLIRPPEFPVGARARIVVISVTEGAGTVKKHPQIFSGADLVVINKIDLAEAMSVSAAELEKDVFAVNPSIHVVPVSCKTGAGIDKLIERVLAL